MKTSQIIEMVQYLDSNVDSKDIPINLDGYVPEKEEYIQSIVSKMLMPEELVLHLSQNPQVQEIGSTRALAGEFKKQFNFNFGVAQFKVDVEVDLKSLNGAVTVDSSIFGVSIGKSTTSIVDGVLNRKEKFDAKLASLTYEFSLKLMVGYLAHLKLMR